MVWLYYKLLLVSTEKYKFPLFFLFFMCYALIWKKVKNSEIGCVRGASFCLYSKHLDINPGDRLNKCCGLLKPIDIEKYKNTYKIIYKCNKCGEKHKNIMANDDNMELIIELSKKDLF